MTEISTSEKKIYLIEKDPAIIDVISIILAEEGYETIISKMPFQIEEIYTQTPVLIVLDNGLNNHGVEICKALRRDKATFMIPIVLSCTNNNLPALAEECGATAYIMKPFDIEEFITLINSVLQGLSGS